MHITVNTGQMAGDTNMKGELFYKSQRRDVESEKIPERLQRLKNFEVERIHPVGKLRECIPDGEHGIFKGRLCRTLFLEISN